MRSHRRTDSGRSHARFGRAVSAAAIPVLLVAAAAAVAGGEPPPAARPKDERPCVVGLTFERAVPGSDLWGLSAPEGLDIDHRGNLLIADTGNDRVLKVTPRGTLVQEFGGYGWADGQFDSPTDLSVLPGFYVYVLDQRNRRVQRFDVRDNFVDLRETEGWAGSPVGIEVRRTGEVLLVDADLQTVLVITQFAELLEPVGDFGLGAGGLARPRDVATGPGREIAVADPGRETVEVFDEFGTYLYSIAAPDTLICEEVLFDRHGNLLVGDVRHGRILAFPPGGGPATATFDGWAAGLTWPSGLALDRDDRLYVLDRERGSVIVVGVTYGDCPLNQ